MVNPIPEKYPTLDTSSLNNKIDDQESRTGFENILKSEKED